jgi:rubrerythrin
MTTKETGGLAPLMTSVSFSAPECALSLEQQQSFLAGTGVNGAFLADLLSSFLMHEQCGLHLYQTAISMTDDPMLEERYREFGAETEEHIRIFEELITACGGQPGYVSPTARLTEALDSMLHQAAILLPDGANQAAFELAVLEAVMLAETKCHADWSLIRKLTAELPDSDARSAFQAAADRVGQQEDEHVRWARETWEELILSQAR